MKESFTQAGPELENEPNPALYIVSTPIGNLEDITLRALRILKGVDLILAEDTRHSGRLLQHYGITTHCEAFNDYNKERRSPAIINYLLEGKRAAILCDAGTPGVADEAFYLVRQAIDAGIPTVPLPGASAVLAALVCSGLPSDRFCFQNFPAKKSAARISELQALKALYADVKHCPTLVYYLAPHNLLQFLNEILIAFGPEQRLVLARELTKYHEEFLRGNPEELLKHYQTKTPKGEMVMLFHPQNKG